MLNYEFLLVASIAPVGALLIGLWFVLESRLRHRRDGKGHSAAE